MKKTLKGVNKIFKKGIRKTLTNVGTMIETLNKDLSGRPFCKMADLNKSILWIITSCKYTLGQCKKYTL